MHTIEDSLTVQGTATIQGITTTEDLILSGQDALWYDSRNQTSLDLVATAIGSNRQDIVIAKEEILDADLAIPEEWRLLFKNGGKISVASGKTLTIGTRAIEAGHWQIFDGAGTFVFPVGAVLFLSWFASLEDALLRTLNSEVSLVIDKPVVLATSSTVGADVTLIWQSPGCQITLNPARTLSGVKRVVAGSFLIFAGSGIITFEDGIHLKTSWFQSLRNCRNYISTTPCLLTIDKNETVDINVLFHEDTCIQVNAGVVLTLVDGVNVRISGKCAAWSTFVTGNGTLTADHGIDYFGVISLLAGEAANDINNNAIKINADKLIIGSGTEFGTGYDPSLLTAQINQAVQDAADALARAAGVEASLDGLITTYWYNGVPPNSLGSNGDLAFNRFDNNKLYMKVAGVWTVTADTRISQLISDLSSVSAMADGKVYMYFLPSSTAPSNPAPSLGDLWYQTDTAVLKTYYGGQWVTPDKGSKVWREYSAPANAVEGDLWVVTDPNNANYGKMFKKVGAQWLWVSDSTVAVFEKGLQTAGSFVAVNGNQTQQAGITGSTGVATDVRVWAGASLANRASAPFRVYNDGAVVADNVTVTDGAVGIKIDGPNGEYTRLRNGSLEFITSDGKMTSYLKRMEYGSALNNAAVVFGTTFLSTPKVAIFPKRLQTFSAASVANDQYIDVAPLNVTTSGFTMRVQLSEGGVSTETKNSSVSQGGSVTDQTAAATVKAVVRLRIQPNYINIWNAWTETTWVGALYRRRINYKLEYKLSSNQNYTSFAQNYVDGQPTTWNPIELVFETPSLSPGVYDIRVSYVSESALSGPHSVYVEATSQPAIVGQSFVWLDLRSYDSFLSVISSGEAYYLAIEGGA